MRFSPVKRAVGQQRKRLLHREEETFHVDVEDRVIELLSYFAERGILCHSGIGEYDIELAFLFFNLPEETIKVGKIRYVSLYSAGISSHFLNRCSQLLLPAPRDEDVRTFVYKLLGRRQANTTGAPGNERNFPVKPVMGFSLPVLDWPRSLHCPVTSTMRNRALPCIMRA